MFVDLVGSTALAARLDPEDMRDIIGAYHRRVAKVVGRYEGFVAKYMGDGVLVYFGYPQAHEDDVERAVRAGLKLTSTMHRVRPRAEVELLQVRIGIATGLVVVGDLIGTGEAQERGVVGETPNLAARLQALAEPNAVVIAASTRRLLGGLFEFEDLGAVEVKGYEAPILAWRVRGQSATESRYDALHSTTASTPLVGREEEAELLMRRWQRASKGEGQVVLVSGEPGIGKSRLIAALQERIEGQPHIRLRHFCSPYHQDSALHPITTQLERGAGITREDPPETRFDKLAALLAPASPPAEDVALLAAVLSIPAAPDHQPPLNLTPLRRKEKTFEALLRQVEDLARQQPVLMTFEDVHWIDPTSSELLNLTIDRVRRLPVLLLITFRPEFAPPWIGQSHVTTMVLNRLDRSEGAALVQQVAGSNPLSNDVVAEIIERTDGVPLFIEELTKAVLEADAHQSDAAKTLAAVPLPALAVPATLHALLMARLDRLGAAAKEIAQVGAAVGREFAYEMLQAVAPQNEKELKDALGRLVGAGLLFQHGTPPQASYVFKHALVQDTAYGALLRGRRHEFHARIATVLQERFPETADIQPELLAHHFSEAGIVEAAIRYWHRAGTRARLRSSDVEATRHLGRALALVEKLPETRERDELELDLCIQLGGALIATTGYGATESRDLFSRARALCDRLGETTPALFPVLYGEWVYEHVNGRLTLSLELAELFVERAKRTADRALEMMGDRLVGFTLLGRGRADLAMPHLRRSVAAYDPRHDVPLGYAYGQNPHVAAQMGVALALGHLGFADQAARLMRQGLEDARALAHANTLAWALCHACLFHLLRREPAAAEPQAAELLDIAREQGAAFWAAIGRAMLTCARASHRITSADHIAQSRREIEELPGQRWFARPCLDLIAAEVLVVAGDTVAAQQLLDETQASIEQWEQRLLEAEAYRVRAELLHISGALTSEVEANLFRAIDVARVQDAKMFELRAVTSLAQLRCDQGRRADAHNLLAPAYGWFTEGFDTPDLLDAKAVLDELSGI